jgi:hypothetical protein
LVYYYSLVLRGQVYSNLGALPVCNECSFLNKEVIFGWWKNQLIVHEDAQYGFGIPRLVRRIEFRQQRI